MNFVIKAGSIFMLLYFLFSNPVQGQDVVFEESETFYPYYVPLKHETAIWESISWGYLSVPENWNIPEGKKIKVAVAILKNLSNIKDADAVVYLEGGPGASCIRNIGFWKRHPLRENNDIILFDVRGAGFSQPRLCPDLGKEFMKLLAKDQTAEEFITKKTAAVMTCRQDMLNRNIDISAYNSLFVSKDLNALKIKLGYEKWHVLAASYGTYMAQVYGSNFPDDVKSLLLDSSISDISTFYIKNTENFMNALSRVFNNCKNDPDCNSDYPDLEQVFYKTIADLEKNPIMVPVDERITESKEFIVNAEEFKLAVQQGLYNKSLIEVIPLLIYQFHNRNLDAISNLVIAFSSFLSLDYGQFYCVSCNEVLPNNDLSKYEDNTAQFQDLRGGLSFYKSDFTICKKWNEPLDDSLMHHHNLAKLADLSIPVIIFAGEFDPITPESNGQEVAENFRNAYVINARTYGHAPSYTRIGNKVVEAFINNPSLKPDLLAFEKATDINFADGIKLNGGVSSMGNSLNQRNPIFFAPLLIALFLMVVFIIIHLIKLIKGKYAVLPDKVIRGMSMLTSLTGVICLVGFVLALTQVSTNNFYILAFGLPDEYNYLFQVLLVFVILLALALIYFTIYVKKINDRSIVFSTIFSQLVVAAYFLYWGVL